MRTHMAHGEAFYTTYIDTYIVRISIEYDFNGVYRMGPPSDVCWLTTPIN